MNKIIIFFAALAIAFLTPINAKSDEDKALEVWQQSMNLCVSERYDEGLKILRKHRKLFQEDDLAMFLYNWTYGMHSCGNNNPQEALPYLQSAVTYMDENALYNEDAYKCLLAAYQILPSISYGQDQDKEKLIEGLKHAKEVYETAGETATDIYSLILRDLAIFTTDAEGLVSEAFKSINSGNYQNAIQPLLQLIEYETMRNNFRNLSDFQHRLANAYINIGDLANAEKYDLSAKEVLESHNLTDDILYRRVLTSLGEYYYVIADYQKAFSLVDQAKIAFEDALDFGDDYVHCLKANSMIQSALGRKTLARLHLDVALHQAKQNLNDSTNIAEELIGILATNSQDKVQQNQKFYLNYRIRPYIRLLSDAAALYSDLGYFSEAVKYAKESVRLCDEYSLNEPMPYNNLGSLYLNKSKFAEALPYLRKAYELCDIPSLSNDIGLNLAFSLFLTNDEQTSMSLISYSSDFRKYIHSIFSFLSTAERSKLWDERHIYLFVANILLSDIGDMQSFGCVYDNILESKGLLLRSSNAIRDAILREGTKEDILTYTRMRQLKQQILAENDSDKRESMMHEIEQLDKQLTKNINEYSKSKITNEINWQDIRKSLKDDEIAIEFIEMPLLNMTEFPEVTGEPRYCALTIRKEYDYPHITTLFTGWRLKELSQEDCYETDSIYRLIWKPLEDELNGVKNAYFSADSELHKIGIEYAPISKNTTIGDKYNLYRLSSTRVLVEQRVKERKESAVLYGGLKYDLTKDDLIAESRSGDYHPTSVSRALPDENLRYGVKYLPGSLKEVEEISKSFNQSPRVITDIRGTEESFKALSGSSIDIIHLATHGFFWNEEDAQKRDYVTFLNPTHRSNQSMADKALMRSGLFFSGANIGLKGDALPDDIEDGVLTAMEISNMNLGDVDMVVMSACETGLGLTSSDGVFGLQRGFKLAGANSLLMSLWKVDDTATQLLMTEFYRNYLSGKSKQQSLKLAQQNLRNSTDYSDPEYWAAFILLDGLNKQ